jgi:hypothetical protein
VGVGFKGSIPKDVMDEFRLKFKHWKAHWMIRTIWEGFIPPIFFTTILKIFTRFVPEE